MALLPLRIKSHSQTLTLTSLRPFSFSSSSSSSSSSPPFPDQNPNSEPTDNTPSPPQSPHSSLFSDIKERLRSPPPPAPRRIPDNPQPPPTGFPNPTPAASLDEIRQHLAQFRIQSPPSSNPNSRPSRDRPISFQELFRSPQDPNSRPGGGGSISYDSIRESIRQYRPTMKNPPRFSVRPGSAVPSLIGDQENLPESIFGKEMREKMGEKGRQEGGNTLKTEFVKMYTFDELGEKLRKLRPDTTEKGGKDWFSLEELNVRLAKLRELEGKESERRAEGRAGGYFDELRQSLTKLNGEEMKKANMRRMPILTNIGLLTTPSFMLKPPQEHLLENVCRECYLVSYDG